MRAKVGDKLVVEGHTDSERRHDGEIIEIRGADGGPPYMVRWADGHEALTYPGADTHVVSSD